jgi:hypothetical protein
MSLAAAILIVIVQAATPEAPDPIDQQIHWGRRLKPPELPITAADIDPTPLRRLGRRRIEELLRGSRMHDPDCTIADGCDEIFLADGTYRRSVSPSTWESGTYVVRRNSYCTRLERSTRCYELWERPGGPWVRVPIGVRRSSGRIVNLIPASR